MRLRVVCAIGAIGVLVCSLDSLYHVPYGEWIGGLLIVVSFLMAGTEWPYGVEHDAEDWRR